MKKVVILLSNEKDMMIRAYKDTENEWNQYSLKEKARKIYEYLSLIEVNTDYERQVIEMQLLFIEELEPSELSEYIEEVHQAIMENSMNIIESMK